MPKAAVATLYRQIASMRVEIRDLKATNDRERARHRMSDHVADLAVRLRDAWRVHPWPNHQVYDAGQVLFDAVKQAEDLERRLDTSTADYKLLGTAP